MVAKPLLELTDIEAGYGELRILRDLALVLEEGTITAIIGANGAGKSTLLKTIFGLVRTSEGRIRFRGEDITAMSPRQRLERGIVLVAQGRNNFPSMTVEENLEMAAYIRRDESVERDIRSKYDLFPVLGERRRARAGDLSGGEQQQLEMAMALMVSPRLALVDEPSMGLAARAQDSVFASIVRLRDEGTTILMVEQNGVQALRVSDRGGVLELGRLTQTGSGVEMLEDPKIRRAYLGI